MKTVQKGLVFIAIAIFTLSACSVKDNRTPNLTGDWEVINNPEISDSVSNNANGTQKAYYSFSELGENGTGEYKTFFDGGIETGKYKLSEKDGKEYIDMGTGELEYKLSDSELTVIYPATSDDPNDKNYVFSRAEAPDYENESYDTYETDKNLIAEWVTDARTLSYYTSDLSYTETIKFKENGIMIINYLSEDLRLDRDMYYAYTAKDNTLTFSSVTDKKTTYEVSYIFDENGNLKFENDETSASIFADAFFSDVTYCRK